MEGWRAGAPRRGSAELNTLRSNWLPQSNIRKDPLRHPIMPPPPSHQPHRHLLLLLRRPPIEDRAEEIPPRGPVFPYHMQIRPLQTLFRYLYLKKRTKKEKQVSFVLQISRAEGWRELISTSFSSTSEYDRRQ